MQPNAGAPDAIPPTGQVLIVPVGGSPEPVRKAVETSGARFVVFVVSPQTAGTVENILASASARPSAWSRIVTPDPQRLDVTFRALVGRLPQILDEWGRSWTDTIVDLTGGTKVMTAALALATIHHAPRYLYIGGEDRRDTGTVRTGTEIPIQAVNPWDDLAYAALRDIARAFNGLRFAEARERCRHARERVSDRTLKAYLHALGKIIEGFAAWDRFEYRAAAGHVTQATVDDLCLFWDGKPQYDACRAQLEACRDRLEELRAQVTADGPGGDVPSRALLLDLLANAWRRGELEQRYDDAVARLYRCVEGVAQLALWQAHGIKTGKVPVDRLPPGDPFDVEVSRAREAGESSVKLGLEKSFQLLAALGGPLADVAARLGRDGDVGKLLQSRNLSLLAHGAHPVAAQTFAALFEACLGLLEVRREDLIRFPVLPES